MAFAIDIRVYIEDTDAGGIVYYVNYLKFMERARTEYLRALGFGKTAICSEDKMFVVHSANVQYLGAARLDDALRVTARPLKLARSNILFAQHVYRQDDLRGEVLLCQADVRIACVERTSNRPCAMPGAMYARVKDDFEQQSAP